MTYIMKINFYGGLTGYQKRKSKVLIICIFDVNDFSYIKVYFTVLSTNKKILICFI